MSRFFKIILFSLFLIFLYGVQVYAQEEPIGIPTLSSPADVAAGVLIPVALDWNDVDGAQSYVFEIYNRGETTFLSLHIVKISQTIVGLESIKKNASYQWLVAACSEDDGRECGSFSQKWEFTTGEIITIGTPSNPDPGDEATGVSIPEKLKWNKVTDAESYLAEVYNKSNNTLVGIDITTEPETDADLCVITINTAYQWQVAACFKDDGKGCGEFSQICSEDNGQTCKKWGFTTGDSATLSPPELISPVSEDEIPIVNLSSFLGWERVCSASSYRYQIKEDGTILIDQVTSSVTIGFNRLWDEILKFNTIYTWRVQPCWDGEGNDCENKSWSDGEFKTTEGIPPALNSPEDGVEEVLIPVNLEWEDVPDAESYQYEISLTDDFAGIDAVLVSMSEASVDYPEVNILTWYWWRVKTCIDEEGIICGNWSGKIRFKTIDLINPANPSPTSGGDLLTYQKRISWGAVPAAKFYQYGIDYASVEGNPPEGEADKDYCRGGIEIVEPTIITSNSVRVNLPCLGNYNWRVRACLEENCDDREEDEGWSYWQLNFVQPIPPAQFGLVSCGRLSDDPDTTWVNERDPCELKHVFLMIKNIIDLLLWRIGLIILVLLVIASGVVYYFSLGAPATIVNAKSIWTTAGKGYAIMFLAWIIINLITIAVGFNIKWFVLPF